MKQAICVISFGTSYHDTRGKTTEPCETEIFNAFPDAHPFRAFTSKMIVKKLKDRDNESVPLPEELFHTLAEDNYTDIIIQPLHLMPGDEFHNKILHPLGGFRNRFNSVRLGMPLLSSHEDCFSVLDVLKDEFPDLHPGEAVVLMGHGTEHPANMVYPALQHMIERRNLPFYVATVEGYPELEEIIPVMKQREIKKCRLLPFMLVAGDHARNDMAGDDDDSWKNILQGEGFETEAVLRGLGELERIRRMYVDHALSSSA